MSRGENLDGRSPGLALVLSLLMALTCIVCAPGSPCAKADDGQATEDDDHPSEARALFLAGRVAFDEGRFEAAIRHFQASYELSERPALLYNIAQCYDRLRRDPQAIEAFERYLQAAPDAENRPTVEARLRALREAVAQSERASAASEAAPRDQPRDAAVTEDAARSSRFPLAPTLVLGAGALVTVSGAVLMWLGKRGGSEVEAAETGASYPALKDDLDRASRQWMVGQVLLGVGAVGLSVGGGWLLLSRRHPTAAVEIAWLGNGFHLKGRF